MECSTSSGDVETSAIAVLTGSLNPVHKGHMEMARFAIRQLKEPDDFHRESSCLLRMMLMCPQKAGLYPFPATPSGHV